MVEQRDRTVADQPITALEAVTHQGALTNRCARLGSTPKGAQWSLTSRKRSGPERSNEVP